LQSFESLGLQSSEFLPNTFALWKAEDAKNPGKGFGVDVSGSWYWYQSWVDHCIEHCKKAGDQYM
jgi:hypothetical protein